jgi:hypothetical protein
MLYGDTDARRSQALLSDDPVALPWIAAQLALIRQAVRALPVGQGPAASPV